MKYSRRGFLQVSSGATLAALAPGSTPAQNQGAVQAERQLTAQPQPMPNGPPVKFASVGVGIEGSILLRACMTLPNAQCVAACDVYDARHTLAKEIAGQNIATTRDIRQTLADPQIEAIVLAVPDHQHAPLAIAALHAYFLSLAIARRAHG